MSERTPEEIAFELESRASTEPGPPPTDEELWASVEARAQLGAPERVELLRLRILDRIADALEGIRDSVSSISGDVASESEAHAYERERAAGRG